MEKNNSDSRTNMKSWQQKDQQEKKAKYHQIKIKVIQKMPSSKNEDRENELSTQQGFHQKNQINDDLKECGVISLDDNA